MLVEVIETAQLHLVTRKINRFEGGERPDITGFSTEKFIEVMLRCFSLELLDFLRACPDRLVEVIQTAQLHLVTRKINRFEGGERPDIIGSSTEEFIEVMLRCFSLQK